MTKMKWALLSTCMIPLVLGTSVFVWASWNIPVAAIEQLRLGYVATDYSQGEVNYRLVKTPPSDWTSLDGITSCTSEVVVLAEDSRFYRHQGFDVVEIRAALLDALLKFKRPRGASTITQQLAKNLFLTNDFSFRRKIREIAIARELESTLSKEKILELYLNIVEYGEGLYGIGNAAEFYFEQEPSNLSLRQSAFLAMLLPNPKSYSECFNERTLSAKAQSTMARLENTYLDRRDLVVNKCESTCKPKRPCPHSQPRNPESNPNWMALPDGRYPQHHEEVAIATLDYARQ